MANKTLSDDDRLAGNAEDSLNPGSDRSKELFDKKGNATGGDLASLEADLDKKYSQDFDAIDNGSDRDSIKSSEENPEQPTSLYNKDSEKKKGSLSAKLLAGSKRFGPTGGVIGIIFAALGITSGFAGPASLLTALSDLTSNHTGLSNHLFLKSGNSYVAAFLKGETRNCETSKIRCKFTTISEKRKAEWEKRGIKVNGGKNSLGRYKVTSLEYKGTKIETIRAYKNLRYTNPDFNSLLKRYSVRAYLLDKGPFQKGPLSKFGKSLGDKFKSNEKKDKSERVSENNKTMNSKTDAPVDAEGRITPESVRNKAEPSTQKASSAAAEKIKGVKSGMKVVGATGNVSNAVVMACMGYDVVRAAQAGILLYWHQQLIDFVLPFLQAGAQAKEGGVNGGFDWATAEYFGDRLTHPITQKEIDADQNDEITQDMLGKTAMDAKGVDAVINGSYANINNPKDYASNYNGWMPVGEMWTSDIVKAIRDAIPGGKDGIQKGCTAAKYVSYVGLAGCVTNPVAFVKCVVVAGVQTAITQVWGQDIVDTIVETLQKPALEAIANANLSSSLTGPPLGQAIVSAAGVMSSYMDNASGFTYAGTDSQAIATYNNMYGDDEYIAELKDDAEKDQLDTTNPYSFASLALSKFTNLNWDGTIFSALANITKTTLNSPLLATSNAFAMQQGLYQPVEIYSSTEKIQGTLKNCKNPALLDIGVPCLGESGRAVPTFMPNIETCMDQEANGGSLCIDKAIDYLSNEKNGYTDDNGDKQPMINEVSGEPTEWSKYKSVEDYKNPFMMFMKYCGRDRPYALGYTDKSVEDTNDSWHVGVNCVAGKNKDVSDETLGWMSYYYHMCIAMYASEEGQDYCWVESAAPAPSGGPWVLPTAGPCLSPYGPRNGVLHAGIDISPPQGTPIVAPTDLKIISAAGKSDGYGNSVVARATDGTNYMFRFGHMLSISVAAGQTVSKGTPLGTVGSTGDSTGPHLHFEIYDPSSPDGAYASNGKPLDPVPILAQHGVIVTC